MAEVPDEVRDEGAWDVRALAAADLITGERTGGAGVPPPAAGADPSQHRNAGEYCLRLGDPGRAHGHGRQARSLLGARSGDAHAKLIRDGVKRLAERLREQWPPPAGHEGRGPRPRMPACRTRLPGGPDRGGAPPPGCGALVRLPRPHRTGRPSLRRSRCPRRQRRPDAGQGGSRPSWMAVVTAAVRSETPSLP
ncbi:hypothetical protein GCM10027440_16700 [Nocardiopsis coralliicola]